MPRLLITAQSTNGPFPADLESLVWTTCDDVNGTRVQLTGRELLFLRGVGTATIVSAPDSAGRIDDIVKVLNSNTDPVYAGPFGMTGWRQSDTPMLHIDTNAPGADVIQIAVLTIF